MVKNPWVILNDSPNIRIKDNVVPGWVCDDIINWGKDKLIPGKVVNGSDGSPSEDLAYRAASVAKFDEPLPHYEKIADGISALTSIDKSRFEKLTLTHYSEGQFFKTHQDYFIEINSNESYTQATKERCEAGGNRLSTIILYLNDVIEGGETHFPWLDVAVTPVKGRFCQFNYDYDEWKDNVKTQHAAAPVIKGEKWIITIWVREKPLSEKVKNYKKFEYESIFLKDIEDVRYSMSCGPEWDVRTMNLSLPANDSPINGIAVAVTGGLESTLLLYLIAVLNSAQVIPYQIVPITVATEKDGDSYKVTENLYAIEQTIKYINENISHSKVQNPLILYPENNPDEKTILHNGLRQIFSKTFKEISRLRFTDFKYVYLGINEMPNDDDVRWKNLTWGRVKTATDVYVQPFFDLQKYHIIDIIIKLKLEKLLDIVGKCSHGHKTYDENCIFFACNERRWGINKLKLGEPYDKYFITKGHDHED